MIDDPMDETPDGLIGLDDRLSRAAGAMADSMFFFSNPIDQRSLTMFGVVYNFSTVKEARDALIEARFRLVRALVTFTYAERARRSVHRLAESLVGDA